MNNRLMESPAAGPPPAFCLFFSFACTRGCDGRPRNVDSSSAEWRPGRSSTSVTGQNELTTTGRRRERAALKPRRPSRKVPLQSLSSSSTGLGAAAAAASTAFGFFLQAVLLLFVASVIRYIGAKNLLKPHLRNPTPILSSISSSLKFINKDQSRGVN